MRQLFALVVCFLISSGSGQAADCRFENGNLNGDELLDLSDAVYSLVYLFADGPPPAPQFVADEECAATLLEELTATKAELASTKAALVESQAEVANLRAALEACQTAPRLPATGQAKCYDAAGTEIACDSTDFPGQDGFYQAGCPIEGRYKDNDDGTVSDLCTGLMWQKDTADTNGDGQYPWSDALAYCENLDLAGHDDWRLPNVRELQSIVYYGRFNPSIDPVFGAWSAGWWSSSTDANNPQHAWLVSFNVGNAGSGSVDKGNSYYVRAVRGGL